MLEETKRDQSDGVEPIHFGIDYDDTFTADPWLWRQFIRQAEERGHRCYIVTCRMDTDENREDVIQEVYGLSSNTGLPRHRHLFTSMGPKRHYCEQKGIRIDIWIDDCPESVKEGR